MWWTRAGWEGGAPCSMGNKEALALESTVGSLECHGWGPEGGGGPEGQEEAVCEDHPAPSHSSLLLSSPPRRRT